MRSFCSVPEHDAVQFLKRKADTKTSAPELDAEVDKEILTIGKYVSFNRGTSYKSKDCHSAYHACFTF
jgi:hypothetical protein